MGGNFYAPTGARVHKSKLKQRRQKRIKEYLIAKRFRVSKKFSDERDATPDAERDATLAGRSLEVKPK
jgi:RNase H-fold protein (predicted Holliday junction resolvase)